jgi:hypothetical protein
MAAAESFYASIQHSGLLDDTRILDAQANAQAGQPMANEVRVPSGVKPQAAQAQPVSKPVQVDTVNIQRSQEQKLVKRDEVRLDLTLWDADQGKQIRLRAPSSMTQASLDRFIQSMKLAIQVTESDPNQG